MVEKLLFNLKAKKEIRKAFKSAGLYVPYKNGDKEIKIYPKILNVHLNTKKKCLTYMFSLVNGMDPKEVLKKEYVFKQHFGSNVELEGDFKTFTLTVFTTSLSPEVPYLFDDIQPIIAPYRLGILCGRDRNGQYVAFDLLKQPHILIAGETGSGKSTQLRSILTTLIKQRKPKDLELYLGDCKKSEFHIFRNVEHVKCVLSKPKDIRKMLSHIKKELDERSDLTEMFEVRHIDHIDYKFKKPYIVVCIDEFVMLRKDEEIMDILTEISAIGRTLGVFLILSMQRPNAEVLDTTIRANLTVSMGFKLRDKIEERIANTPGASDIKLSGRFIMNSDKLYELQAPFLDIDDFKIDGKTYSGAKTLLSPFMVAKGDIKEVFEKEAPPVELTEEDVFIDAIE